ncbi:peptidase aspartic [Nannochloropsis oceanica]
MDNDNAPSRPRTIEEVGTATLPFSRADFPPTPDTQFPASVDYLLTLSVLIGGKSFEFTVDTTASVNLVTREVADALNSVSESSPAVAAAAAGGKKGFGGGGGGGGGGKVKGKKGDKKKQKKQKRKQEEEEKGGMGLDEDEEELLKSEEIALDILLPSTPGNVHVYTRAVVSDVWGGIGAGCLGLPFLRSFGAVEINLRTMEGRVKSPKGGPTVLKGIEELKASEGGREGEREGSGGRKGWTVDFAPLTIKMDARMALEAYQKGETEEEDSDEEDGEGGGERGGERPEHFELEGSQGPGISIGEEGRERGREGGGEEGRVVTPTMAGEEEGVEGAGGIEVCFAEETRLSLGSGAPGSTSSKESGSSSSYIEIPSRRLAIADLPVFAYAGLGNTPAMVLGLDVLGSAADRLILDWAQRRMTLEGPLLPIRRAMATLELPLVKCVSEKVVLGTRETGGGKEMGSSIFGVPWQYGVPAVMEEGGGKGGKEVLFMLDTAAGGTLLRKEMWEMCAAGKEGGKEGGKEDEIVRMAGPGAGGEVRARKVSINLYLGGTSVREGHEMSIGAAVLLGGGEEGGREGGGEWSSSERFDGILGQSFFGAFEIVDFDWRHAMLRCYERGKEGEAGKEGGLALEGLLDFWPVSSSPSSTPAGAARLRKGVAENLLGSNSLLSVTVILNNQINKPVVGLLDTGAQTSVLNWAAARALGIEKGRGGRAKESQIVALGLDGKPVKLMYAKFDEVAFEGGRDGGGLDVVPNHTGGKNLAIADVPGLAKLGLLETPAMVVGLDLLEGGRGGRLVFDMKGGLLYIA